MMTAPHLAGRLPAIGVVRRWSQSLAVLDAIMSAEREDRYFSYDTEFGPGQALASMRNGSGDEYSITFTGDGAFLRGFDHESPLSPFSRTPPALWPGILTGLPAELAAVAQAVAGGDRVDPVAQLGTEADRADPVPHQCAELADLRRGDPRLGQQVRPQQLRQDRRVGLVFFSRAEAIALHRSGCTRCESKS